MGAPAGSSGVATLPCASALFWSGHPSVAADISPALLVGGVDRSHVHGHVPLPPRGAVTGLLLSKDNAPGAPSIPGALFTPQPPPGLRAARATSPPPPQDP